ncbi:MAG: class II aldolase/adducin family protein [Elusimicrobiota bacterium]|jgi:L-fuculose-phosphate aldolase
MLREIQARKALADCGRRLAAQGHMPATAGNISVRLDGRRVLITPTAAAKAALRPQDLVLVDMAGRVLKGDFKPTSELGLHLAAYRLRPDVRAVVHAHPPAATAFACAGVPLPKDLAGEIVIALKDVPLVRFFLPGSALSGSEMPADLEKALRTREAALLAHHGALCLGKDLEEAAQRMELLEHSAWVCLAARLIGVRSRLSPAQLSALCVLSARYGK